jgi:cytochrome c peroxidase
MARQRRSLGQALTIPIVIAVMVLGLDRTGGLQAQTQTFQCTAPGGFGGEAAVVAPALALTSLKTVANPVLPTNPVTGALVLNAEYADYIASIPAAIRLGKALFWDMQAGSDTKTACASCHFNAGGDTRERNQVSPGPNGAWDLAGFGPNSTLWPGGFPFTMQTFDTDNIVGSQGVRKATFGSIDAIGNELIAPAADAVFSLGGINVRQVTGKNAPSVVNAVFNHRNFFNGRAQPEFNGVNPFGTRDTSAKVYMVNSIGGATAMTIVIKNAALASQAVGPPLNTTEMSAAGRTFQDLGRKMLRRKPLGLQQVSGADSVLGAVADAPTGLATTYTALIRAAFKSKWWNSNAQIAIGGKSYSMTEANFSLFWGLSIMFYEATLVADDSPLDQFLTYRSVAGSLPNPALLDSAAAAASQFMPGVTHDNILNGLALFELAPPPAAPPNGVGCVLCHGGAELTSASVRAMTAGIEPGDQAFRNAGFDLRMERMFMQIPPVPPGTNQVTLDPNTYDVTATNTLTGATNPVRVATYDAGWYNIGVRPTADDLGLDATDPFGKPLSFTRYFQGKYADPSFIKVPGNGLACGGVLINNASGVPFLSGGLKKTEATDTAGSFKVASLRNVELTGPYFHTGGKSTLAQVIDFYSAGGDFSNPALAPLIRPLNLSADARRDLLTLLLALTDERVRRQQAPFDHPQLFIPNGDDPWAFGVDSMIELPAVGAAGGSDSQRFLNLNPFAR